MLLTTWHHAPAARMEPEQRWLQSRWQRDTGSVLLWWGTEPKGPWCGAGLGGDVQTCQGRHPWLQADEKVPFKTCHHPGLPNHSSRAGLAGRQQEKRDKSGGNVSHFSPQTLRKRNKLSSAELISETLHVFDHFVSDLHLKCALAAPSQDFLPTSHELFLQAAPACCTSLGEQQGGSS